MRKFFKKYTPNREMVKEYKFLAFLGNSLFHEDLWRFNRLSFCRATVIGVFWGWMPMFFQMIPAAYCAVLFRANLPLSVAGVWISNPITICLFEVVETTVVKVLLDKLASACEKLFAIYYPEVLVYILPENGLCHPQKYRRQY